MGEVEQNVSANLASYHEGRAEEELALAQRAKLAAVVKAHMELAEMHLAEIYDSPANEEDIHKEAS